MSRNTKKIEAFDEKDSPAFPASNYSGNLASCETPEDQSAAHNNATTQTGPRCSLDSLPALPDVRITLATQEAAPAPHCKVAGVIGTEINFELLLPDDWALNNLERLVNFGLVAVHRTAVTAKALTEDYYGQNIERSYFGGCSSLLL